MSDAPDYNAARRRLWNWGRWARQNPDAPDGSCANPLYDLMIERADGWGDNPPATTSRTQPAGIEQPEIDEWDAECVDVLVRQVPQQHRTLLVRVYVLRVGAGSQIDVDAAIRAMWDVEAASRRVIVAMRERGVL